MRFRRFKFTLSFILLFGIMCGILLATAGPGAWWYALACSVLLLFIFLGEVLPRGRS